MPLATPTIAISLIPSSARIPPTAETCPAPPVSYTHLVKVIASSLRKGNVVEMDGKLYAVLKAENFHPGKGTPTTSVDMRRISDGVKVAERWRTTEMVEKANVDEREYDFLYEDGEGFHFMEPATYEQITVTTDVVGDDKAFLTDGIKVCLLYTSRCV